MPNSKRTKQKAFAILIALLMMVSFIANAGAEVLNLAPEYAKPGDTIDILSWNIVGPVGGTELVNIDWRFRGTEIDDVLWAQILLNDEVYRTIYLLGIIDMGYYPIAYGENLKVTLRFKIDEAAMHGDEVDGFIQAYTLTVEGDPSGTDGQPIDPDGYTIIDDEKPYVESVTVVPNPAIEGGVTVTVDFNEVMDMGVNPTVEVTGLNRPYTVDGNFLIPGDIWVGTFDLVDDDEEKIAYISVSGGQDIAGNVMDPALEAGSFQVDTVEPNVVSIEANDPMITDADIGNPFEVIVTFDENMDMSVNPTVSFTPDVTATLPSLTGSWDDGYHYVVGCLIADGNQEVARVSVSVSGAQDIAGNPHGSVGLMKLFAIDNKNPTVDSATAVPDPAKAGLVTVTVEFSENMNPTVGLRPTVEVTGLKSLYDDFGILLDLNTWEGTFELIDEDEVATAYISVSGGQDLAGNLMVAELEAGSFQVDTINPEVSAYGVSDLLITEADIGGTFYVQVGYNEAMNTLVNPSVSFSQDVTATLLFTGGYWDKIGDDDYYRANYQILAGNQELDVVDTTWTGAEDLAGNTQVSFTSSWPFDIDTKAPIIVSFFRSDPVITESDIPGPFYITLGFSEPITTTMMIVNLIPDVTGTLTITNIDLQTQNLQVTYAIFDGDQETYVDVYVEGFVDLAGNLLVPITFEDKFYIDNLEPTVTITIDDPINIANVGSVEVTITSNEDGTYSYNIGGEIGSGDIYDGTPVVFDLDLSGLPDGSVTADASVEDAAGNVGHAPQVEAYKDATAPDPYIVYISLIDDADSNGIANIGDTLRVEADMTLHPDTASVTADLRAYGGSETEALDPINGAWTVDFVIVDSPTGIDVGDYDPLSAVTVTATDNVGNTATATSDPLISDHGVDSLAPEPLTELTATAIADGKIRLDWTASVAPDLASYIIYRDDDYNPGTKIATVGPVESWTDEDPLLDGLEYYYRMKSVDDADNIGDYSDEASATSDSTPPDAPDVDKLVVTENPPGTADTIEGLPEAVEPYAEVTVYSDSALTDVIGTDMATADGSFPAIDIGDNLNAKVWVTATDAAGNEGPCTMKTNDIEAPEIISISWSIGSMPEVIRAGDEITITLTGEAGCTATYDIPGLPVGGSMVQDPYGTYTGSYTVQVGDDGSYLIDGYLEDAAGNVASIIGTTPTDEPPFLLREGGTGTAELSSEEEHSGEWSIELETIVGPTDRAEIRIFPEGLKLDDLNSLSYWSFTESKDIISQVDVFVDIWLDFSGSGELDSTNYPGYLQSERLYTYGEGPIGEWFFTDAMSMKWSTYVGPDDPYCAPTIYNFQNQDYTPCVHDNTLDDWTGGVDFGDLDVLVLDVRVGYGGTWNDFTGYTDDIRINNVIYNLEKPFRIDTTLPTVSIELSDTLITQIDVLGTFEVTATFSEAMDTAYIPTVSFDQNVDSTLTFPSYAWNVDHTVYTATYTIEDANVEVPLVSVSVGGAQDLAGNIQVPDPATAADKLSIDTILPTVSIELSDTLITQIDVLGTFEVTATFSEAMDTAYIPTVSFDQNVDSTLTFPSYAWNVDHTVYTATYTIADAGAEVSGMVVTVGGAQDLAGNIQVPDPATAADKLSIDTLEPTVTDLEISDNDDWIREEDIPGPFNVTVTFSEPMSVDPTISFSPDVSTTLTFPSYAWNVDHTVYTATYTIEDVNEEEYDVVVSVSGAEDLVGNLQVPYNAVEEDWFDVDTLHGTSEPTSIEVKANTFDSVTVTIVDPVTLVATVENWFGEPIPDGVEVSFATDLGTIYPYVVPTEDGSAETSIYSTEVGTATVTATAGGVSDSCTVTFVEQTIEIELSLGWNLVSVPRTLADPAIEDVFAGITTVEKVYTYHEGEWYAAFYDGVVWEYPILDHSVDNIVDGKGYWVYTSEPNEVIIKLKPLEIMETPPSYPLPAEWSLIGYTSIQLDEDMPIDNYLGYLTWNTLYRFDPNTRMYEIAKPDLGFEYTELGRGYWIHLNELGDLVP